MRNDKNNIVKRKRDIFLALLIVVLMMFSCITNVFAVGPDDETTESQQVTEQTEAQSTTEAVTEATEPTTEATTEAPATEDLTTVATEPPTTVQQTTEPAESTTYEELIQATEEVTERNPWDFEVPTEGTIEAEQTKADYFTGTVMWSAVGGGLLILLIMFIGKRKY